MIKQGVAPLILLVFASAFLFVNEQHKDQQNGIVLEGEPPGIVSVTDVTDSSFAPIGEPTHFSATVSDKSDSLKELKENADLIVIGSVVKQEQASSMAVFSTIEVENSHKGENHETIRVTQLGNLNYPDSYLLQSDENYLLFLGRQSEDDETLFYIKGGVQGAFLNKNGELRNSDFTMRQELQNTLQKTKSLGLSELETIERFIQE